MRVIATLLLAAGTAGGQEERRFFPTEVDFWGRPPRPRPAVLWRGEAPPPPGPARDLLEAPTPENARRYLEWQEGRLERLQRALEALESVAAPGTNAKDLILFSRDDCPYSRAQEEVLRGLPLTVLRPGQSPALWTRYGVTATPTLVVNGRPLVGLTDRTTVERAMRAGRTP